MNIQDTKCAKSIYYITKNNVIIICKSEMCIRDRAQSEYVEVTKEENNEEPVYTLSEEFYGIPHLSVLN